MLAKQYITIEIDPRTKETKRKEKLRKRNFIRKQQQAKKQKELRKFMALTVFMIISLGITAIWLDSKVYAAQHQLTQIKKEIRDLNQENTNLTVELLDRSSINEIKTKAEKLGMVIPTKDTVTSVDLDKNNFIPDETKNNVAER